MKPVVLLILDGWGIGPDYEGNAVIKASTPNMDKLWQSYPHTLLEASSQAVGLPINTDGNSETGHINIGAGRIVEQDLVKINSSINDKSFFQNQAFLQAIDHVKRNGSALHLIGLVGEGRVHSSFDHLLALLKLARDNFVSQVFIHVFTDGRDSDPKSGALWVEKLEAKCKELNLGQVASVMGRLFAMDRDNQWDRVEKAYDCLTIGTNDIKPKAVEAIKALYQNNITDEFIEPFSVGQEKSRVIKENDAVIFFNFRIDRARELTRAFVDPLFQNFERKKLVGNLFFTTMSEYEKNLPIEAAFKNQVIENNLGEVMAANNLRQLRITETEKEKMVGYYINGASENIFDQEERITIPSKGVESYVQAPEMSAKEITAQALTSFRQNSFDVYIINLANPDMVGHTGDMKACIKACEIVDEMVGAMAEQIKQLGGALIITADHGNAEEVIVQGTKKKDTQHSINPVPFILVANQFENKNVLLPVGVLADIAPTMLKLLKIQKPIEMTGRSLV
jgi:2,3-bisphosphoglycerate-independent phosphoglycerate mutase